MSLSKQFFSQPTDQVFPNRKRGDLRNHFNVFIQAAMARPWVRNYIFSRRVQMAIDAGVAVVSFTLAHILRFDGWPPGIDDDRMLMVLPYLIVARLSVNYLMGLYSRVWRYVSIPDAWRLSCSVGLISAILMALRLAFPGIYPMLTVPITIVVMDF